MDPFSTEIEGWQKKYSFLEKGLKLFEGFNAIVKDESKGRYGPCDFIPIHENVHENRPKYKYFCMKLIRNIWSIDELEEEDVAADVTGDGIVSEDALKNALKTEKNVRCDYLNTWIPYYMKKIGDIPHYFIKNVFDITHTMIKSNPNAYQCEYDSYNEKFVEPYNMAKLHIFSLNFGDFLYMIKINEQKEHDDFLKYILECAAIYKKIKTTYCHANYDGTQLKLANTCSELQEFKSIYDRELSEVWWLREKLPKLDDPITEAEQRILLEQEEFNAAQNGFLSGSLQRNLSTGAVAAAGTGALLLALNKFTPLGSWFRSGKRRTPDVENILEEGPSEELFLNDPDYMRMNSDTTSYNVGYGSTENY